MAADNPHAAGARNILFGLFSTLIGANAILNASFVPLTGLAAGFLPNMNCIIFDYWKGDAKSMSRDIRAHRQRRNPNHRRACCVAVLRETEFSTKSPAFQRGRWHSFSQFQAPFKVRAHRIRDDLQFNKFHILISFRVSISSYTVAFSAVIHKHYRGKRGTKRQQKTYRGEL